MVKIRRAYEVLFLGLFLFFLLITDLRYLKGWPVSLVPRGDAAGGRRHGAHDPHHLPQPGLGPGDHRGHDDARPGLVQLDVPVRHPAPLLRLDRQPAQHQADDRGEPLPQDLRAQVLHPGRDDRDGLPLDHPHRLGSPGKISPPTEARICKQTGAARVFAAIGTGISQAAEEHKTGSSTLQIGLLDPIALTVRSMTTSVLPTVHKATESVYTEPREYWQAWVVGLIFIGLLVANWWIPRFFCRALCPLGALAGGLQPVRPLADRSRPGALHRLRPLPEELRGGVRPARRPAQERVLRLPELHRGLPARCPHVPVPASQGERGGVSGRRPAAVGAGRDSSALLFFPMARLSGGVTQELQPARDPAAGLGGRGRVPPPLHQVRPVHPRLPHERPPAQPCSRRASRGCGRRS